MTLPSALVEQPKAGDLDRWLVFATTWALAVLFHLAGNSWLAPWWGKALLGLGALAVLARPRSVAPVVVLALAVLANVWLEAPLLSNHFLLHGMIALVVLGVVVLGPTGPERAMAHMLGPLRLLLLAFYGFAALAKLNHDFFDPAVSCGAQFLRESASSWGFGSLVDDLGAGPNRAIAVAVAGIELSVPILLAVRRTRVVGVVVAVAFHFVLAINQDHQFFDFSAVLVVLFLLFLPSETVAALVDRLRRLSTGLRHRWTSGPELLRLGGIAVAATVAVGAAWSEELDLRWVLHDAGVWSWLGYGMATLVVVALAVRGSPERAGPLLAPGTRRILLAVPVLAVLNGLTPYVEVKTAASWNMYSNLAVVDGESNHLLVRRGLPLTDAHERLVEIIEADGVDLGFYIGSDWRLPEVMLEDHLAERPGAVVVGLVDGEEVRYDGGQGGARPTWRQKLQVFRAVDGEGPVGCQPSFGPAR